MLKKINMPQSIQWQQITIAPIFASLSIAPEITWSKEYDLRSNGHFPIILRCERKITTKQKQRWSIKRTNWIQFQIESILTTKLQDQGLIVAKKIPSPKVLQKWREDHQRYGEMKNVKGKIVILRLFQCRGAINKEFSENIWNKLWAHYTPKPQTEGVDKFKRVNEKCKSRNLRW